VNIQTKGNTSQALSAIKLYLPPNDIIGEMPITCDTNVY